jgi:polysaccharide biosynthesis protein PslL
MNRQEWIDILKGIGIICVVAGHAMTGSIRDTVFLFHMPLFFFLSGFLFYPRPDRASYLSRKIIHLLIPYFIFLTLLFIPRFYHASLTVSSNADYLRDTLLVMFSGGSQLKGTAGVFWFVTCLFLTQQLVNGVLSTNLKRWAPFLFTALLVLGYLNQIFFPHVQLAWAANIVLFAAPVFYIGFLFRGRTIGSKTIVIVLLCAFASLAAAWWGALPAMDMKMANYSVPILSLTAALVCILALVQASRWLEKFNLPRVFLGTLGRASMMILFLHLSVIVLLGDYLHMENEWVLLFAGLALPLAAYWLSSQFRLTRALLLGSEPDFAQLFQHSAPSIPSSSK